MKQFVAAFAILAVVTFCSAFPVNTDINTDVHVERGHVIKERAAGLGLPFLGGGSASGSQASAASESGSVGIGFGPLQAGVSGSRSSAQSKSGSIAGLGGFL